MTMFKSDLKPFSAATNKFAHAQAFSGATARHLGHRRARPRLFRSLGLLHSRRSG